MANYQVAAGYNNAAGLADFSTPFEPRCHGLRGGRRLVAGDGVVKQDGRRNTSLIFSFFSAAQVNTLLTQLGLDYDTETVSGKFTVTLPSNQDRAFGNYNAVITLPDPIADTEFDRGKWLPFVLTLTNIHEAS
jgi:hypothetical protein